MSAPPRDWSTIKALFQRAIELEPGAREAFLTSACGADAVLRAEVESLLAAHDDERPFLEAPVAGAARVLGAALDEAAASAGLKPGTRIGQYEVLEPIGSGGMGDVYRAHDTKLDRFVALKIVLDTAAGPTGDRVLREARAASALNHPNICTVYEAGEFEDQAYLAMEYIAGQPLGSLIPSGGFAPADAIRHGVQIADALAHAHEHGVIHRDLKSANVVVTPQGRAKVLDFGIARREAAAGAGVGAVTIGAVETTSGTLACMAPELLRGQPADARSDIWALGVLLYELAAGRRPYTGDTAVALTSAILKEPLPPLPETVPPALRAVIVGCLQRNPDDRPQRALEIVAALEAGAGTPRVEGSIRGLRRVALPFGVAAAVLAATSVAMLWRPGGTTRAQHTQNAEAHALYVRGRDELARNLPSTVAAAVAVFQGAVDRDPSDVLAHAGLAMASARTALFFAKEDEAPGWRKRAHEAAQRALQLDPELAQTHEALAAVFRSTEFDWRGTITESIAALDRDPTLDQPHLFLASAFMHLGLLDRAAAEAQTAMDMNQTNLAEALRVQGVAAMYASQSEAAVSILQRASAASKSPAEWNLAYAYYNAGQPENAETMLRQIGGGSARNQRRAQATLAGVLAAQRKETEARKLIDEVIAGSYRDHHVAYALGAAYAQLGMPSEALTWLRTARDSGFSCYPWFEADPLLAPMKESAAFRSFLDDFKQSWQMNRAQFAGR